MDLKKLLLLLLGGAALAYGEVRFSQPHLSEENTVLFQGTAKGPGHREFHTLFFTDIKTATQKQLSLYPEEFHYIPQTGEIQIQNRFGLFRSKGGMGQFHPVPGFPSFLQGKPLENGKIFPVSHSPDGRFILYLDPISAAYGDLRLFDTKEGRSTLVSRHIDLSLRGPEAIWSNNSRYFVYIKAGSVYYFSIEQYLNSRLVAENYRSIGSGRVSSLHWNQNGDLFYLSGTLVYRISSGELFARSLYPDIIPIGRVVGRLPLPFKPDFDRFWLAPDGNSLFLSTGGGYVFYCPLGEANNQSLIYLSLPSGMRSAELLWSKDGLVTILTRGRQNGREISQLFRIDLQAAEPKFGRTGDSGVLSMSLSPDGRQAALRTSRGIDRRDYRMWTSTGFISHQKPLKMVWVDEDSLIVAGEYAVARYSRDQDSPGLICLSQPQDYGFQGRKVVVKSGNQSYLYDPISDAWEAVAIFAPERGITTNRYYRVYLEDLPPGPLQNIPMLRGQGESGTRSLLPPPKTSYPRLPLEDEEIDFNNFTHGSRIRGRQIALTFDLVDSTEGLNHILEVLADYNIRATFFLNGDFIRNYPASVRNLAASEHEIASLFYTHLNMTDPRYGVNPDFVKQGLAQNEQEYQELTNNVLSLLWHAPYYVVRNDILKAASELGYTHIGRDLDWMVMEGNQDTPWQRRPAADLLERILDKKKPGSIVSFRVETPKDGGNLSRDYLFSKLDLLINQLISQGYEIVPVSVLKDNAK